MKDNRRMPETVVTQHSEMRKRNEAAVLSLLRREDGLPSSIVASRTGLAPQTVSVLLKSLEDRGLVRRGKGVKGKRGQPAVPLHLEPNAACTIGISIDWQHIDLALINMGGELIAQERMNFKFPLIEDLLERIVLQVTDLVKNKSCCTFDEISGIGVARPRFVPNYGERFSAPTHICDYLNGRKFSDELSTAMNMPVALVPQGHAACVAETAFASILPTAAIGYLFLSSSVTGGMHIPGKEMGAFDVRPVNTGDTLVPDSAMQMTQLHNLASVVSFENFMKKRGIALDTTNPDLWDWDKMAEDVDVWIEGASSGLSVSVFNATAIARLSCMILDGVFPKHIMARIVKRTEEKAVQLGANTSYHPKVTQGTLGFKSPALGAAFNVLDLQLFSAG